MNYVTVTRKDNTGATYAERWVQNGTDWHCVRSFENGAWVDDPDYAPIPDSAMQSYAKCFNTAEWSEDLTLIRNTDTVIVWDGE